VSRSARSGSALSSNALGSSAPGRDDQEAEVRAGQADQVALHGLVAVAR